jgi:hypothetical protein
VQSGFLSAINQSLSAEAPAARHACDTAIEGKSMTDGLIIHFREKNVLVAAANGKTVLWRVWKETHTPQCL